MSDSDLLDNWLYVSGGYIGDTIYLGDVDYETYILIRQYREQECDAREWFDAMIQDEEIEDKYAEFKHRRMLRNTFEELMAEAWHPRRVALKLEQGIDMESW